MNKLLTKLLLLPAALCILLLSVYTQYYADRQGETLSQSAINVKYFTNADCGGVKIIQSRIFKKFSSAAGKEKEQFKIDPAEVEEDELNSFSKYLTGSRHFSLMENTQASGDLLRNLVGNRYSTLFPSYEKYIQLQVFRI